MTSYRNDQPKAQERETTDRLEAARATLLSLMELKVRHLGMSLWDIRPYPHEMTIGEAVTALTRTPEEEEAMVEAAARALERMAVHIDGGGKDYYVADFTGSESCESLAREALRAAGVIR